MATCGERAILVITQPASGTSTNVVRRKVELTCGLAPGHDGLHNDAERHETWKAAASTNLRTAGASAVVDSTTGVPSSSPLTMILRHEDDAS